MAHHERMFRHEHAHKLDDPSRQEWLPPAAVLERLALQPGMNVADIGAGTGYFTIPMAKAVAPGGQVFAVDVQPEMLNLLRSRLDPTAPVKLIEGEATRTTLADSSVDLALVANVWHELDDQDAALREMARIVRPGGRLALLDWRPHVEQPPGPPLEHRVSAGDAAVTLRSNGWRSDQPETVGLYSWLILAGHP